MTDHQTTNRPNWDLLYEIAAGQEGHFTSRQAIEAGYSLQLLAKYIKSGRITRIRRGIYRLIHFPTGDHEEFVVIWLWAEQAAVMSHETALMLHGLSDLMTAKVNITLPSFWRRRRLRVPEGVVLHFADIENEDRTWMGAVPVTTVARTLCDCVDARVAPDFVRDAFQVADARGLIDRNALPGVVSYLSRFFSGLNSDSNPNLNSSQGISND